MSIAGYAEGRLDFRPPITPAGEDMLLHPDNGRSWARLVVDPDGTASTLEAVVESEDGAYGVCFIAFEIADFARRHRELDFTGAVDYCDDSGHRGDQWRITVHRHQDGTNRTHLTRPTRDGTWPDPSAEGSPVGKDRWPRGW